MTWPLSVPSPVDLCQRLIKDMNVRVFSAKSQQDYLRIFSRFAAVLGRSPSTATVEKVRLEADKGQRARGVLGWKGDGREICCPPTRWRDRGNVSGTTERELTCVGSNKLTQVGQGDIFILFHRSGISPCPIL